MPLTRIAHNRQFDITEVIVKQRLHLIKDDVQPVQNGLWVIQKAQIAEI